MRWLQSHVDYSSNQWKCPGAASLEAFWCLHLTDDELEVPDFLLYFPMPNQTSNGFGCINDKSDLLPAQLHHIQGLALLLLLLPAHPTVRCASSALPLIALPWLLLLLRRVGRRLLAAANGSLKQMEKRWSCTVERPVCHFYATLTSAGKHRPEGTRPVVPLTHGG